MSHSARPTYQQMLDVLHLMADVAALKGDPLAQRKLLVDELTRIVGINQGLLIVGEDWRPHRKARISQMTMGGVWDPVYSSYLSEVAARSTIDCDVFADQSRSDPSETQEWSFAKVFPDRQAKQRYPLSVECCEVGRVTEGAVHFVRLNGDRALGLAMHSFGGDRPPTRKSRALAAFAIQEVARLARCGHLQLPAQSPAGLPPRLHQVLEALLCGRAPKQIAHELGLSVWTVREHIQRLYRYFGVSGRDELAARFLGRERLR